MILESHIIPPENIYGHTKRLRWIMSWIGKEDTLVELGCGTGYMISLPLARMGYTVHGVDLDDKSIRYGQRIFERAGLNPGMLKVMDIKDLDVTADVIVASEILEHIPPGDMDSVFSAIRSKLKPGGRLLITVPNGYGWFELESLLWYKLGLGRVLGHLRLDYLIKRIKHLIFRRPVEEPYPSTLSGSPHVQRFTYKGIQRLLRHYGFEILSSTGSVLIAGPFSNLLFSGVNPAMRLNATLGKWLPGVAAGFYIACRLSEKG